MCVPFVLYFLCESYLYASNNSCLTARPQVRVLLSLRLAVWDADKQQGELYGGISDDDMGPLNAGDAQVPPGAKSALHVHDVTSFGGCWVAKSSLWCSSAECCVKGLPLG